MEGKTEARGRTGVDLGFFAIAFCLVPKGIISIVELLMNTKKNWKLVIRDDDSSFSFSAYSFGGNYSIQDIFHHLW